MMPPYASSPDFLTTPTSNYNYAPKNSQEDVIFSLTDRLRECESELREMKQEKSALENQLRLRGKKKQLEFAYEELLTRFNEREEEIKVVTRENEELLVRQRELEIVNRKLQQTIESQRHLLGEQEEEVFEREKEIDSDFRRMRRQLDNAIESRHIALEENEDKKRQIISLEKVVEHLTKEVDHYKDKEKEAKSLLAHLSERVEEFRYASEKNENLMYKQEEELRLMSRKNRELLERQHEFEQIIRDLQNDLDSQQCLLREKEEEFSKELNYDLQQLRHHLSSIIESQRTVLDEKDDEIRRLSKELDYFEGIAEDATQSERSKENEINQLREENTRLLNQINNLQSDCQVGYGCGNSNMFQGLSSDIGALSNYMKK